MLFNVKIFIVIFLTFSTLFSIVFFCALIDIYVISNINYVTFNFTYPGAVTGRAARATEGAREQHRAPPAVARRTARRRRRVLPAGAARPPRAPRSAPPPRPPLLTPGLLHVPLVMCVRLVHESPHLDEDACSLSLMYSWYL